MKRLRPKDPEVIRLERDGADYLIPKGFFGILVHRLFPVLALGYICSVLGISILLGDVYAYLFEEKTAYEMALSFTLWASVPAIVWIFLSNNPVLTHIADFWYRLIAVLFSVVIFLTWFFFPETENYGFNIFATLCLPIFLSIYFLFIRRSLPLAASYPLNALGFCVLLYGSLINVIF